MRTDVSGSAGKGVEKRRTVKQVGSSAVISGCGIYRYRLTRIIGHGPAATFIMLNPSTADADVDDPTIRKCIGFCREWSCGQLQVVNLFAVRATLPSDVKRVRDPVGPENKKAFDEAMRIIHGSGVDKPEPVVCAWGTHGGHRDQDLEVMRWLRGYPKIKPVALGITKHGHPKHPLYVPYSATLVPYAGRR